MADWSHPVLTDTYAYFLSYLTARDLDAATMGLAGLPTNPPGFFIKADTTNRQLYYFDTGSSSYLPLFGGSWAINITGSAASVSAITSAQVTSALGFTPLSNAAGAVGSSNIATGGVTTPDLAANSVTAAKIALGAFTTIASASTVDLGAQSSRNIQITGTTTVTSFGATASADNVPYILEFASALSITGSSSLLLPGGIASGTLTINAGETILVVRDSSTVWHIVSVFKPYGTSAGQAVALDSTGKLPAVDGSQLTGLSASGRLLRAPQFLTSGTSYTTPVGCNYIFVQMAGGGGGGATGRAGGGDSPSTGGHGGAYLEKLVAVTSNTAYAITVGAGGSAGIWSGGVAWGGTGGSSTITIGATTYTAGGGGGGTYGYTPYPTVYTGGVATNGDINITGTTTPTTSRPGSTANGPLYNPYGVGAIGTAATGYGCGGGSGADSGNSGGAGKSGFIRIWEYS